VGAAAWFYSVSFQFHHLRSSASWSSVEA